MKIFDKFKNFSQALKKTKNNISEKINAIFSSSKLDDNYIEKIEEVLITSDISFEASSEIIEDLRKTVAKEKELNPDKIQSALKKVVKDKISKDFSPIDFNNKKTIFLIVGVNGAGKTTTVGKLANFYKNEGRNVLIAACDTFRAAGTEQMEIWGKKTGIPVVVGKENQDPASVAHDASIMLKEKDFDVLLVDTAGRLHNKKHLMDELAKIKRTISKAAGIPPQETIIVIDASLGQNSIAQIEQFKKLIDVSGIIITKLDGSAKGGIIIDAISKLDLPVRFIGTGETIDDISEFSSEMFVDNIF
ncbi:MAG: signal recognition particle-docking protein FtsY [Candidatus Acididesulfobacter guangdongensis]|uniref:Signal recognition particle-docking protein FtsY n=1 Tax=Acididesulfobacter guangdongensis TaxID=2597225 RepID=A0A519BI96_ACIG2|nr:MAG: signal recognition particle-docking protein FtsY [Candidatus Acididesulfobacter guangdongensis]